MGSLEVDQGGSVVRQRKAMMVARNSALLALKMKGEAIGCVMGQGSDVYLL